jgi:DNA-binding XRE family transcriptional regulator
MSAVVDLDARRQSARLTADERAVLRRAVADTERWSNDLPPDSTWRLAFFLAARELRCALGDNAPDREIFPNGDEARRGNRLGKLRRRQALSLEDVASARGVSRSTVHRWELGLVQIPDEHKLALADLFGVSVVFLMGQENRNAVEGDR